jgi:hypothetical protein
VLPPHDCPRRHVSSVSPTCGRPRVSWANGCLWSASFWAKRRKKRRWKQGNKSSLPMFSARPKEEEDVWCRSKRHRFGSFFF